MVGLIFLREGYTLKHDYEIFSLLNMNAVQVLANFNLCLLYLSSLLGIHHSLVHMLFAQTIRK